MSIQGVSGSGKSTTGRAIARLLDVPYLELDALVHGPGWVQAPAEEVRRRVAPVLGQDAWVIDGGYRSLLGDTVFERADTVVWLDLPLRVWLPRLTRRTVRRMLTGEELWNGNRERFRNLFERPNLFEWALRKHFSDRRDLPARVAEHPHLRLVRLRSPREVAAFLEAIRENRPS